MDMDSNPLVSVIIPTYNRAQLLPAAIESVLSQGYSNTEIIIVDDGSTDDTQEVVGRFGKRIKVVAQENKGAASARNHGIKISKGAIIAFLDSDDLWLPNKLERQIAILQNTDPIISCCLCNIQLCYSDGRVGTSFDLSLIKPTIEEGLWVNVLEVLATRFILFNQSIAIRREALNKVGGFDESFKYMEDHDLALRLALLGPWAFIREPLVIWNEGTIGSLTKQAEKQQIIVSKTILDIYRKIVLLAKEYPSCPQNLCQQLIFELNRVNIRFRAVELSSFPSFWRKIIGYFLRKLEQSFDKIYTNSPWYPKMKVTPIAGWQSEDKV